MASPVQPIALRPHQVQPDAPLESPEVLIINALLDADGGFRPEVHGVGKEMLRAHQKVWEWCLDYQVKTGSPPSRTLLSRSHPSFEILTGVNVDWAADKLRDAFAAGEMRRMIQGAIFSMNEGDMAGAQDLISAAARPRQLSRPHGMDVLDPASVDESAIKIAYPVPYATLQGCTHGIGLGELWYLGARLGQGKSWLLPLYAVAAAAAGADVGVLTLEMPKRIWIHRVQAYLAAGNPALQAALRSSDMTTRKVAVSSLPPLLGSIEVLDPSDIKMNTRAVSSVALERKLVIVDHVGLMQDPAGKRSVEDWRTAAVISNSLKEISLELNCAVLAAAQINREGESQTATPPKVSQLAQSDALGQDADTVITLKRMGINAMMHSVGKNRSGPDQVRFYSQFRPAVADFSEISKDQALTSALEDEQRRGED